jgi:hypothetical protein
MPDPTPATAPWLLLVHQLPTEPSRVRVKTWRRLQGVGAVAVKNSVYVLPNCPESREDFEWIRTEIVTQGGEAMVFSAQTIDELSAAEIRDALERARQADWQELDEKCQEVLATHAAGGPLAPETLDHLQRQAKTLRAQAARIDRIDYFQVSGRTEVLAALERIERLIDPRRDDGGEGPPRRSLERYQGRVWLTRPRPGVDRMASAWLIRRFVDPQARFRFSERIPQREEVVPFDMFGVDLGHHGERVTFETLLQEFGLSNPGLTRIARIVHELDLRADTLSDVEAATVERLVEGLRASFHDDEELLDHGIALFEALYASFSSPAHPA